MCFPRRFLFFEFIFFPFFYFPVSFSLFSEKRPKKRENSRHCVTKYLFAFALLRHLCYYIMTQKNYLPLCYCVRKWKKILRHYAKELFALYLRHYAKELFASDERFIYTTMWKKYLHSQHSLDIFHISRSGSRRRVFVFGFTFSIST